MLIVTKQSILSQKVEMEKIRLLLTKTKQDVEEARSQGDLSENFGYHAARAEAANLSKILEDKTNEFAEAAQGVDPLDWAKLDMDGVPRAMVGALITFERDNKEEKYLIGGAWDKHPSILPYTSPLAKALIPKREGTEINFEVGEETQKITLLKTEVPTKEFLQSLYEPEQKKSVKKALPAEEIDPSME